MDDVVFKKPSVTIRGVGGLSHFAIQERPEEKPPVVTPPVSTTPVFADVPVGHWAEAAIRQVAARGLMAGVGNNVFNPDGVITRAQLVTVLYRAAGSPANGSGSFKDVPENAYFHDAVLWANANGIASGYGGGVLGPSDPLSREQMVTMLYRYAIWSSKAPQLDLSSIDISQFTDWALVSSYAQNAVRWAIGMGIINGSSNTTLSLKATSTRAQMAVVMNRFAI